MRESADIVIVGGGVVGCSIAYYTSKKFPEKKIVLLEKDYITAGSTGRNAASCKEQWESLTKCHMGKFSLEQFKTLGDETGYGDLEFVQDGYMFTLYKPEQVEEWRKRQKMQNAIGIPTRELSPEEVKEIIPDFDTTGLLAGFLNPDDAHINPFFLTFAFQKGAKERGVEFEIGTEVTDLISEDGRMKAVVTNKGTIETPMVVNATDAEAKFLSRMLGLYHPIEPKKHSLLVTERVEYQNIPMVVSYEQGICIHQVPDGGFLMGINVEPNQRMGVIDYSENWEFLEGTCKRVCKVLPSLAKARVIRQWAGHYGMTPDMNVVVGKTEVEGYLLAVGAAKGLMFSPAIGTLVTEIIAGTPDEESALPFSKDEINVFRFKDYFVNPAGSKKVVMKKD